MRTLTAGGLFGMGPGGGTRKFGLPEPHTDYIFSVIGEEFGLIACLAIACLYLGIVARVLIKLLDEDNSFAILAAAGLAIEFGLQALINMMVNVQLAPSKGMTLPFISYGGISMLALSIGMGLLLAFTRRNPYLDPLALCREMERGDCLTGMNFVLAAGGTGGHMVPAHALAAELKSRGHGVLLITDDRGARFPGLFEDVPVHILPAGRLGGGPIGWLKARGAVARRAAARPSACTASIGPTRSSASAAIRPSRRCSRRARCSIPTVLHEQNAVLGRVNRLLAGEAEAIGTAYDEVDRLKPQLSRQGGAGRQSGPRGDRAARRAAVPAVRRDRAAQDPRHRRKPGRDACSARSCPTGLGLLQPSLRRRLQVVQQCRPDDIERVREPLCRARHPRRAPDLHRGHARQARRRASGDRPRRRLDHRRADRRRAAGDPHSRSPPRPTITRPPTRAR